jgi:MinD-like ATPase involved in chromosome partitioning or flagellar assembly
MDSEHTNHDPLGDGLEDLFGPLENAAPVEEEVSSDLASPEWENGSFDPDAAVPLPAEEPSAVVEDESAEEEGLMALVKAIHSQISSLSGEVQTLKSEVESGLGEVRERIERYESNRTRALPAATDEETPSDEEALPPEPTIDPVLVLKDRIVALRDELAGAEQKVQDLQSARQAAQHAADSAEGVGDSIPESESFVTAARLKAEEHSEALIRAEAYRDDLLFDLEKSQRELREHQGDEAQLPSSEEVVSAVSESPISETLDPFEVSNTSHDQDQDLGSYSATSIEDPTVDEDPFGKTPLDNDPFGDVSHNVEVTEDPFASVPVHEDPFAETAEVPTAPETDLFAAPPVEDEEDPFASVPVHEDPFAETAEVPTAPEMDPFAAPLPSDDDPFGVGTSESHDPFTAPSIADDPFGAVPDAADDPFGVGTSESHDSFAVNETISSTAPPADPFGVATPESHDPFGGGEEVSTRGDSDDPFGVATPESHDPFGGGFEDAEIAEVETVPASDYNDPFGSAPAPDWNDVETPASSGGISAGMFDEPEAGPATIAAVETPLAGAQIPTPVDLLIAVASIDEERISDSTMLAQAAKLRETAVSSDSGQKRGGLRKKGKPTIEALPFENLVHGQPLITVFFSPSGGVGKSSSAVNYAVQCAKAAEQQAAEQQRKGIAVERIPRILVVDGDVVHGSLALRLAGRLTPSMFDLFEALDERKAALNIDSREPNKAAWITNYEHSQTGEPAVRDFMLFHESIPNLDLLAAPDDPDMFYELKAQDYHEMLAMLSRFYDMIVIDSGTEVVMPSTRTWLAHAHAVMLLTSPDIDRLHNAKKQARIITTQRPDPADRSSNPRLLDPLVTRDKIAVTLVKADLAIESGLGSPEEVLAETFETIDERQRFYINDFDRDLRRANNKGQFLVLQNQEYARELNALAKFAFTRYSAKRG